MDCMLMECTRSPIIQEKKSRLRFDNARQSQALTGDNSSSQLKPSKLKKKRVRFESTIRRESCKHNASAAEQAFAFDNALLRIAACHELSPNSSLHVNSKGE